MAALVIAWPAGMLPYKKLRQRISRELRKEVYTEVVVVSFNGDQISLDDVTKLNLWDLCTMGKSMCLDTAPGYAWSDPDEMIVSEEVYICGRDTDRHVLGVCLGLKEKHRVHVLRDLCASVSKELNIRALSIVGSTIGFNNLMDSYRIGVRRTQGGRAKGIESESATCAKGC